MATAIEAPRPDRPIGPARRLETSRTAIEEGLGTELENVFPDDGGEKQAAPEAQPAGLFGMVGRRQRQAARRATTSKPLFLPRPRWRIISPSRWRSRSADPAERMIGQYLIDMVDEAGYLTGELDAVAEKLGASPARVEAVLAETAGASIRRAYSRAI